MTRTRGFIISSRQHRSPESAVVLVFQLLLLALCNNHPTFGFLTSSSSSSQRATPRSLHDNFATARSFTISSSSAAAAAAITTTTTVLSMMKGSVFCAVTIDGFIATTDGDISFLNEFGPPSPADESTTEQEQQQQSPEEDPYTFENFLASVDVIIMGRKTFEKVLSFGRDTWAYGSTRLVVWTTQGSAYAIPDYLQESVSCSNLSPTALWDDLQNQGYEHAYIDGGATIATFCEANLIEDWILTRVPLLLGQGIPLFSPTSTRRLRLNHVHTQSASTGLVTSHYRSRREGGQPGNTEEDQAKQQK